MPNAETLALHGGTPVRDVQKNPWPTWPRVSGPLWNERVEPALREVFLSGSEALPGTRAKEFAAQFARYCGSRYGVLVPHGTDAIAAALAATLDLDGWREGGEVIVPNYTFIATASAVIDRRCRIAIVDINPATFTMSPEALEAAIRPGETTAVVTVHVAGHPADMDRINSIASRAGIPVIEDCAQAHGAEVNGAKVGSLSAAGAFSFQSSKNLTSGEGGCVTTDDEEVHNRIVSFMDVGRDPKGPRWEYPRLGWNFRTSEYVAALLSVRLESLEEEIERRTANANYLNRRLGEIEGVTPPLPAPWATRHAYHVYPMLVDPEAFGGHGRDAILAALATEGIPVTPGYTKMLSDQLALARLRAKYPDLMRVEPCPVTEDVCSRSIWTYQWVLLAEREDMDDVVEAVAKVQRALRSSGRPDDQ